MRFKALLPAVLATMLCVWPACDEEEGRQQGGEYKDIESKRVELIGQEESLRKEEERLNSLRKELDGQIQKYEELLKQLESAVRELENAREGNMKHLVKTFEAMPAEDAAERLSSLPEDTAALIVTGMNSRKAGAAMSLMTPAKVTSLTRKIKAAVKKIPAP